MKKIILLLSILVVITHSKAQVTHRYLNAVTQFLDTAGHVIAQSYGNSHGGVIYVGKRLIKIDWKLRSRKVYAIVATGDQETVDENYKLQEFTVMEMKDQVSVHLLVAFILLAIGRSQDITLGDTPARASSRDAIKVNALIRGHTLGDR